MRRESKERRKLRREQENASEIYDQIKFLTKIIALLYIHTSLEFSFFRNFLGEIFLHERKFFSSSGFSSCSEHFFCCCLRFRVRNLFDVGENKVFSLSFRQ